MVQQEREWLPGKEVQRRNIGNDIMRDKQRKKMRSIENQMRREFGNKEYNTFQ